MCGKTLGFCVHCRGNSLEWPREAYPQKIHCVFACCAADLLPTPSYLRLRAATCPGRPACIVKCSIWTTSWLSRVGSVVAVKEGSISALLLHPPLIRKAISRCSGALFVASWGLGVVSGYLVASSWPSWSSVAVVVMVLLVVLVVVAIMVVVVPWHDPIPYFSVPAPASRCRYGSSSLRSYAPAACCWLQCLQY